MFHNDLTRNCRRVAVFLITIAGLLILLALLSNNAGPIVTASSGGSTPTAIPPESLVPISVDNVAQLTQIEQYGEGTVRGVEWTPDGEHIIAYGSPGYWVYDVNNPDAEPEFADLGLFAYNIAFSDDGETLILATVSDESVSKSTIYLVDFATGEITYTLKTGLEPALSLATGNGLLLYHDWSTGSLYGWDIKQKRERFGYKTEQNDIIVAMDFEEETGVVGILSSILYNDGYTLTLIDTNTGDELASTVVEFAQDPQMPAGSPPYGRVLLEKDRVIVASLVEWFEWDADLENGRFNPESKHPLETDGARLGISDLVTLHDDAGILVKRSISNISFYIYRDDNLSAINYRSSEMIYAGGGMRLHPERNLILYPNRDSVDIVDVLSGDVIKTVPVKHLQSIFSDDVTFDQDRIIAHDWQTVTVQHSGNFYKLEDEIEQISSVLPGDDVLYISGSHYPAIFAWNYESGTNREIHRTDTGTITGGRFPMINRIFTTQRLQNFCTVTIWWKGNIRFLTNHRM